MVNMIILPLEANFADSAPNNSKLRDNYLANNSDEVLHVGS